MCNTTNIYLENLIQFVVVSLTIYKKLMNSSSTKTNSTILWNLDGSQEQVKEDSSIKLNPPHKIDNSTDSNHGKIGRQKQKKEEEDLTDIEGGTQSLDDGDNILETYSKVASTNNDFVNTFKQTLLKQTELLRSIISLIGKQ